MNGSELEPELELRIYICRSEHHGVIGDGWMVGVVLHLPILLLLFVVGFLFGVS